MTDMYLDTVERSQADTNGFELLVCVSKILFNVLRLISFGLQTHQVSEIHALVSSSKPLLSWTARDAIQEAREACGGHGFLRVSSLFNYFR